MGQRKTKYTQEQIAFIFDLRANGNTLDQITKEYNQHEAGWKASSCAIEHVIRRNKAHYPTVEGGKVVGAPEVEEDQVIEAFSVWVKIRKYIPKRVVFSAASGFSGTLINFLFEDYEGLEKTCRDLRPDIFDDVIDETYFTDDNFTKLKASTLLHEKFFVTTAVVGGIPHAAALKSIRSFCKLNSAKLLVLLATDPATNKDRKYKFSVHPDIPAESIVFRDLNLNEKLFISSVKTNAKQTNPLLGLKRLGALGSCILGSTKQCLEAVPVFDTQEVPHHIMTTGAITIPQYTTKDYIEDKAEYLATSTHVLGGLVVEIQDGKVAYSRQVQIQKDGTFCDLDLKYSPQGVESVTIELIQQPDWHCLETDPIFRQAAKDITALLKPDIMTLEDFCDNNTINPFDRKKIINKTKKLKMIGVSSLSEELHACGEELNELCTWDVKKIVIKWGNHDNFLKRWLEEAEYADDVVNHYEGVCLAKGMLEGHQPFEFAMLERHDLDDPEKITFLTVNESFIVNGIENGVHGHLGSGGKRNPGMQGLIVYGPVNVGHTHAPAIMGDVFRVGTATVMNMGYNVGASAWCNTLLIQHYDGSRQLITVIDGQWTTRFKK